MTKNLFFSIPAFKEGEVLIFSADRCTARTAAALTGVCGQAHDDVEPRLILCDADDKAQCDTAKAAHEADIPVLFLTRSGMSPSWIPPRHAFLSVPIRFSEFHRTLLSLFEEIPNEEKQYVTIQPPQRYTAIRAENGMAVSGNVRVPLTPCEERLLTALTDAYPHSASGTQLEKAFSRHGGNSVRVYITYLRKKLSAMPSFRAILAEKDGGFSLVLQTDNTDKG